MRFDWKIYFLVIFLVLFGFYVFGNGKISGNVVFLGIEEGYNCSSDAMESIWQEVFNENSQNIVIYREGYVNGVCKNYLATKINEDSSVRYLLFRSNGEYGSVDRKIFAIYANVSDEFRNEFGNLSNYDEGFEIWGNIMPGDLKDWSLENESLAIGSFEYIFNVGFLDSVYSSMIGAWGSGYESARTIEENNVNEAIDLAILDSKSLAWVNYSYSDLSEYDPAYSVLRKDIEDYTFEKNSDWNYAFNTSEFFDYYGGAAGDVYFQFSYIGENNSIGEWINSKVTVGVVNFRPASDFLGSRDFRLISYVMKGLEEVYLNESNDFTVTIVEEINDPPVLKKDIENIDVLSSGSTDVYLDFYFEDPEGEALSYRTSDVENVTISFDGDKMNVKLKGGFSDYEKLRIYASDGESEKVSNEFFIFELEGDGEGVEENLSMAEILEESEEQRGLDEGVEEDIDEGMKINWVFWLLSGLILVGVIAFIVYYFTLGKNIRANGTTGDFISPPNPENPGSGNKSKVQQYIKNLNLKK